MDEAKACGLDKLTPADASDFGIDGTPESWVHLLTAMAKHESDFKPDLTFQESAALGGVISTGLFQMSFKSVRAYAKFARNDLIKAQVAAATTNKLKDPFYNIMVAVLILNRWVKGDGVIASSSSPWKGGAQYWSVLRRGAPKVKATLKTIGRITTTRKPGKTRKSSEAAPATRKASKSKVTATSRGMAGPREVAMALAERDRLGSTCNWVFEVDYSINSKHPRFFVYSIRDKKLYKYKCAHGIGRKNRDPHDGNIREVSNVPNSQCSSLGAVKTGEHYDSDVVGEAVRLHGLSPTNSKILERGVVIHGGPYVFDNEKNTDSSISGRSHGCIVVDDRYIDRETGGELIEWLKNGSIGVAHYDGKFKLPA